MKISLKLQSSYNYKRTGEVLCLSRCLRLGLPNGAVFDLRPTTYDLRAGNNPIEIEATVGNVLLMRASGFKGIDNCLVHQDEIRPFDFITNIPIQRYTLALRQEVT
ncbi:MAG: hypothetical protein GVY17_00885 [Cyanobacteria bacterium]|nr:hypothetical protein [Cyanobacteria bacterium GSL.Bin21]